VFGFAEFYIIVFLNSRNDIPPYKWPDFKCGQNWFSSSSWPYVYSWANTINNS